MYENGSPSCGLGLLRKAGRKASGDSVTFYWTLEWAERVTEHGIIFVARRTCSNIKLTSSRAFHEWQCMFKSGLTEIGATNKNTFSRGQSFTRKQVIDKRDQRRMARIDQGNRRATNINRRRRCRGVQIGIAQHITCQSSSQMAYNSKWAYDTT